MLRQAQHERGICGSILRQAQNHHKRRNFCLGTYLRYYFSFKIDICTKCDELASQFIRRNKRAIIYWSLFDNKDELLWLK